MRKLSITSLAGSLAGVAALIASLAPLPVAAQQLEQISVEGETAIRAEPGIVRVGAAAADVVLVEYFDYNCPYCRRIVPTFKSLLATDPKLAIIYKDWPVLGAASTYAARCALAARWQDKYLAAHDALLSGPRLGANDQINAILQSAGIDLVRLRHDLEAHATEIDALLGRNAAEAGALELDGTPGILVGRQLMPGGADLPFLQKLIAAVRGSR